MYKKLLLFFAFICFISAATLYTADSGVKEITSKTFEQVKKGVWLVEFYAHWCGHCKRFVKTYKEVASKLKGVANIGAVNAAQQRTPIQVRSVPQLKLFINGRKIDYNGPKTTQEIVKFVKTNLKSKK